MRPRSGLANWRNALLARTPADTYPTPAIAECSPSTGSTAGGTSVTVTGTGFLTHWGAMNVRAVYFGAAQASDVAVVDAETLTCTTPAAAAGAATCLVQSNGGDGLKGAAFAFVAPVVTGISPPTGASVGGDAVTVTGSHLMGVTRITVGDVDCTGVTVVDDNTVTCVTAAMPGGYLDVTAYAGSGSGTLVAGFLSVAPLSFVSCNPSHGDSASVVPVTLTGTGFTGVTAIEIEPYTTGVAFVIVDDTTITMDLDGPGLGASPSDALDFRIIITLSTNEIMAVAAFTFDP